MIPVVFMVVILDAKSGGPGCTCLVVAPASVPPQNSEYSSAFFPIKIHGEN